MTIENQEIEETEVIEPQAELDTKELIAQQLEATEQTEQPEVKPDAAEPEAKQAAEGEPEPDKAEEPEQYSAKFNGYTNQEKEVLSKLPADVQKIIDAREEKFHKGIDGYRSAAKFGENVGRLLTPDIEYLKQYNVTPGEFVTRLITAERNLRSQDPATRINAAHAILNDYGIDLNTLTQVQFDPRLHSLQQENQQYRSMVEQVQASRQSAEVSEAQQMIAEFGQSHEYYEQLRPVMADLLDKGLAGSLDEAYEKAIRFDDTVFKQYQAKQLEELKRQDALKANEAAKAAKAAAVSVRGGSPSGISQPQTPANTQDAVRQAMDALGL